MVTTSERQGQSSPRWVRILSRPGMLGFSGVFSFVVGGGIGTLWVLGLRDHWSRPARQYCNDVLPFANPYRTLLSWVALAAALAATLSLSRLAAGRGTPKGLAVYWLASVVLWLALATIVYAGLFIGCVYDS